MDMSFVIISQDELDELLPKAVDGNIVPLASWQGQLVINCTVAHQAQWALIELANMRAHPILTLSDVLTGAPDDNDDDDDDDDDE